MRVKTVCSLMVGMLGMLGSTVAKADEPASAPPPAAAPGSSETPVAAATAPMGMPETKMQLGADAAFVLPLGTFSDAAKFGVGALVRYEYNVMPQLNVTGRLGFVYYVTKDLGIDYKFWNIPALVGVKYDIAQGFYGAAEAGLFFNHASGTFLGMSSSNTETDFGGGIAAGYRAGDLEARIGLQWADLGNAGDSMGLMANVGYSFMKM